MQSALSQKRSEVNLTLGGIDLNNTGRYASSLHFPWSSALNHLAYSCNCLSCSVVVREDKKLLTILFPDGCDGRAFTLKVIHLQVYITISFLHSDRNLHHCFSFSCKTVCFYAFFPQMCAFSYSRLRHLRICANGRRPQNMPLHKPQVLTLLWNTIGFFGMTQMIQLMDLYSNVCI